MPAPVEQASTNVSAVADFCQKHHSDTYPFIDPTKADLSNQTVVITGASRGIGRATAFSFVRAGCRRLVITARSPLKDFAAELRQEAKSVEAAAKEVSEHFGGVVDTLVNNAGYLNASQLMGEGDPAEWLQTFEVNIKGLYRVSRYFLPLVLKSTTSKTVINVGSAGANYIVPGMSAYQTTKFTLCRFNEFMATEYQDQGLVAVAVHPGCLKTELASNLPTEYHELLSDAPELPGDTFAWIAREKRDWLSGRYMEAVWDMEEFEGKKEDVVQRDVLKFRMTL
ncbi:NAD(P)-binding protein [Apiospora sp. TS-2023a]